MKDEIKEILEYLNRCKNLKRSTVLTYGELSILLEHITSLQQEIKNLKFILSGHWEEYENGGDKE